MAFTVDLFQPVNETEPNDSPATGQRVTLPASIVGVIGKAGDIDCFRFEAKAGQEVGVQAVTAAIGSKLDAVVQLTAPNGQIVAEGKSGLLGYACRQAGVYAVSIHDREFRGGADMPYRLHLGEIPIVTSVFPLGLQRGTEADINLEGVHLGTQKLTRLKAAADAAPGSTLPVTVATPRGPALGNPSVVVGEFQEIVPVPKAAAASPFTANGRINEPGKAEAWPFLAKKGRRLVVETNARRLGSPLDSTIEILDAKGQSVPRVTLRCLAQTFTTFRDHDSAGPGIRLDQWNELAINDYLLVGTELVRVWELPRGPDDDCQFYSVNGQRLGWLDTTPTHHSQGLPMYKVAIHLPGMTFPPNGLPIVTLYYRNDDGGPGYGKDSRLFFDPPADGEYQVRVTDARGYGGSDYSYRLTVRPPRPGFNVSFNPTAPSVWKGGAVPITVNADRTDGFTGPIEVRLDNLPPGFSAPVTTIPAEENSTTFALFADSNAVSPMKASPLKLVAKASIDGKDVVREVTGGLPKVVDPADLQTRTQQLEVTLVPGQQVGVVVTIDRLSGFKGRVPIEVKGLPHGVRVLDVGLNGILITEKETTRTFVLFAEPWVQPMTHPFVVLAKREGKNTEHAAKSVLLRVSGPAK